MPRGRTSPIRNGRAAGTTNSHDGRRNIAVPIRAGHAGDHRRRGRNDGDLGHSFSQNVDVLPLILQRFPATLQLALAGLLIELIIGVPLGLLAATHRDSWPGIGKLAVDSIRTADVPLIMGTVLFATLCIVIANLAVDVAGAIVDPRIRF